MVGHIPALRRPPGPKGRLASFLVRIFSRRGELEVGWAPYNLHPTPYALRPLHPSPSLHPAPYTVHRTPLHPTPYTLHPTPYTLAPTPSTLHTNAGAYIVGIFLGRYQVRSPAHKHTLSRTLSHTLSHTVGYTTGSRLKPCHARPFVGVSGPFSIANPESIIFVY